MVCNIHHRQDGSAHYLLQVVRGDVSRPFTERNVQFCRHPPRCRSPRHQHLRAQDCPVRQGDHDSQGSLRGGLSAQQQLCAVLQEGDHR